MPDPLDQPCCVALLTPAGRGAVATVSVEGQSAVDRVSQFFTPAGKSSLADRNDFEIVFGRWRRADGTSEELVVCRRSKRQVEIHCHGGHAVAAGIIDGLVDGGCRLIDADEWIGRQEPDPLKAAARAALTRATTERSAAMLLDQYRGALSAELAHIESAIAEQQWKAAIVRLETLLAHADVGLHLTVPWRVVLCGRPNVGKSSLINAILGYQRAIVFSEAGTTRDIVTAQTAIDGWAVELADTAGLRSSNDPVEAAGVALARDRLADADLVVLVSEAAAAWTSTEAAVLRAATNALIVYNKSDLAAAGELAAGERPPGIATSALTGTGVESLIHEIGRALVRNAPAPGTAIPFTERQFQRIGKLLEAVRRKDLQAARLKIYD